MALKCAHRRCWILLLHSDGTMTVHSLYPAGDSGPQKRTDDVYAAINKDSHCLFLALFGIFHTRSCVELLNVLQVPWVGTTLA